MDALLLLSLEMGKMQATATFNVTFIEQAPLQIVTSTFSGTVGTVQTGTLSFTGGGGGPYTITASSNLPPGLSMSSAGIIGGTPTAAGTTIASITVIG